MIIVISTLVCLIVLPLFGSLIIVKFGEIKLNKLYEYKKHLWKEQNKFHTKLFWEAIKAKDVDKAKKYYNIDGFIFGSFRVLCNGIIIGITTETPIDKDWKESGDKRMESYLKPEDHV